MTKSEFRDFCTRYIDTSRSSPYVKYDRLSLFELPARDIHMDVLAEFKNLEFLIITNSDLKTLGSEIGMLQKLRTLLIEECPFEEVPEIVFKLENLSTFGLKRGALKSVPPSIFEKKSIVNMYLDHNQIVSLPNLSSKNENLRVLTLCHNRIKYFPDSFLLNFPNLEEIKLNGNPLGK